jgi:hypothetical protein
VPTNLLGYGNSWLGHVGRVRGGRLGRAKNSAQKLISNKKSFFSNLFYKLQINLNSNQI